VGLHQDTFTKHYKRTPSNEARKGDIISKNKLTRALEHEIKILLARPAEKINTQDIAKTEPTIWLNAKRPTLYKPAKQPVTLRLDSDIVTWLKDHTKERDFQTEINRVLRHYVAEAQRKVS
jgi:uncharacterized protein (DUF4415 family)